MLCLVLVVGLLPQMAFAETFETETVVAIEQNEELALWSPEVIPVVHDRTIGEIMEMEEQLSHSGFNWRKQTRYAEAPKLTGPYSAGSLNAEDIADAENAMKMIRFLAGVPHEDVCFREDLNNIAQHGAVLMAASNQFSHYPAQPDDMSDEFYQLGFRGCREANISAGRGNIANLVLGFVYDSGANNVSRVGHRRWVFNPGNQNFGIGYARNAGSGDRYGGHRISMHVFDGLGPWDCESDSYIAWPNAGNCPIQYFAADTEISSVIDAPWSINLGSPYAEPSKEEVVLKLTRQRDGKKWVFDADTPDLGEVGMSDDELHLAVDNDGYGMTKAIVFRPDLASLGRIRHGDRFTVELSGIKTAGGSPTTLEYEIHFFDMEKETGRSDVIFSVLHNGAGVKNALVTLGEQELYTDANGRAVFRVENNGDYAYSVSKAGYPAKRGTVSVKTRGEDVEIALKRADEIPFLLGDLDLSESVDVYDAVMLFQHSMLPDLYPIPYTGSVDFNRDGAVDVYDAVLLFQYSMLPDLYPIG